MRPYVLLALKQKPKPIARGLQYGKEQIMTLAGMTAGEGETDLGRELDEMAGQIGRIQDRLDEIGEEWRERA